jgi:diaminopimelate decarboxylase
MRWAKPRLMVPQPARGDGDRETVRFCGPTCFENDVIGAFEVPVETAREQLRVGCTVLFENVSGYAAAWNVGFNGIPPAQVVLLE